MKIAVTTPTGHIGSVLTGKLLDAGAEVTLLARKPEKVKSFTDRGARAVQGTLDDAEYVEKATRGADALFWLTPPSFAAHDFRAYQNEIARSGARAARANSIPRVVHLSSLGAHRSEGTGPILGLHDAEAMFDEAAKNVTHLRPGMFMENHLNTLESIRTANSVFLPISGDFTARFIATRDIAGFAARRLLDGGWSGKSVQELHGPERLTFDQVAALISEAAGQPVAHVPVGRDQTIEALVGMGASPNVAETMAELYDGARKGLLEPTQPLTPERTGSTRFAEFAREVLVPALRGSGAVS